MYSFNRTARNTKTALYATRALTALVPVLILFSLEASCRADIQELETSNQWSAIDPSGTWCGAKALLLIARAEGFSYTLDDVKSMLGGDDSSDGTVSLASLCAALESLGFAAVAVQCRLERLQQHQGIALTVHDLCSEWDTRTTRHCMVFLGYEDGHYSVVDPFHAGRIQFMSESDFRDSWTTHAVFIVRQESELPELRTWTRFLITGLFLQIFVASGLWVCRNALFHTPGCWAVILLSLVGCNGGVGGGEMVESEVFEFEYYTHDAGPILLGSQGGSRPMLTHAFTFVNRGDHPIQVTEGRTNCPCYVLRYPEGPVQPGKRGTVYVRANVSGLAGPVTVNALLSMATPAQEWVRLELRGFVVRPPYIRRGRFDFGTVDADASERRAIELVVPLMPGEVLPSVNATTAAGQFECSCETMGREELGEIGAVGKYRIECSIVSGAHGAELRDTLIVSVEGRGEVLSIPLRARAAAPE